MRWKRLLKWLVWLLGLGLVGVLATEECLYRATLSRLPALPPKPERVSMPPSWLLLRWLSMERTLTPQVEPIWPGTVTLIVLKVALLEQRPQETVPVGLGLAERVAGHWVFGLQREGVKTLWKTLERMALAIWLTRNWSTEELLTYDAEHGFLGHGVTGMRAGAAVLLGRDWAGLDAAGVALLVSVSDGPVRRMDPWCFPERVRKRRDGLLKRLAEAGGLAPDELAAALQAPLRLAERPAHWRPCPKQ